MVSEHLWIEITSPQDQPERVWMCNLHPGEQEHRKQWEPEPTTTDEIERLRTVVSERDRLVEIKEWHQNEWPRPLRRDQIDWLVGQAELAFELGDLLPRKELTITRLRDQLRRLEWAGGRRVHPTRAGSCPACQRLQPAGHRDDCWLAKELAGNDEAPPTREG